MAPSRKQKWWTKYSVRNKKKGRSVEQRIPDRSTPVKPRVYVYGGGVTGLTVAHELAIRDFEVHLYEKERELGPRGVLDDPSLGGMARTQYFATSKKQKNYYHVDALHRLLLLMRELRDEKIHGKLLELAKMQSDRRAEEQADLASMDDEMKSLRDREKELLKSKKRLEQLQAYKGKRIKARRVIEQRSPPSGEGESNAVDEKLSKLLGEEARLLEECEELERLLDDEDKILRARQELLERLKAEYEFSWTLPCFLKEIWLSLIMRPESRVSKRLILVLTKVLNEDLKSGRWLSYAFSMAPVEALLESLLRTLGDASARRVPVPDDSAVQTLVAWVHRDLGSISQSASKKPSKADRRRAEEEMAEQLMRVMMRVYAITSPEGQSAGMTLVRLLKILSRDICKRGPLPRSVDSAFRDLLKVLLPSIDPLFYFLSQMGSPQEASRDVAEMRSERNRSSASREEDPRVRESWTANFLPEYWVEFDSFGKMTPDSEQGLGKLIDYVNDLVSAKYFRTELELEEEVEIRIQVCLDPGLFGLKDVPGVSSAVNVSTPKVRAMVKMLEERLQKGLNKSLPVKTAAVWNGGYLKAYSAPGVAPVARNWVRVMLYRPLLPGEHGYRFFPSYYRHVFDTMRRIPLANSTGQPVAGTVLDNLVPLPHIGIFTHRSPPFIMGWNSIQAGEMLSRAEYSQRNLAKLEIEPRELLQFSLRVLRYMTSCSRRRAQEMEKVSWWEYLENLDDANRPRYRYGESFKHLIQSSSRVLAALDGAHGDARTCGNTYVQLLSEMLVPTSLNNCTLNGPTSESWFFHWRQHLEELGVKFHHGELRELSWSGRRLTARVRRFPKDKRLSKFESHGKKVVAKEGKKSAPQPVYFVVATDLVSAARAAKKLKLKMAAKLHAFAFGGSSGGMVGSAAPDPEQLSARGSGDRLQTISGIQFFFKKHVNVFDGYIYCVDAEWGLSAICSQQAWCNRPLNPDAEYQSILSVDIGDWEKPSERLGKPARECSPEELAEEVLYQLRVSLTSRGKSQGPVGFGLPDPDWVHIDECLEFESITTPGKARRLVRNTSPYLVPIANDWQNRPGPEPWDPSPNAVRPPYWEHEKESWQALRGGYPIHYGRLVFAGTYLKTFTRMTTMESANESARHAVNAVLDHYTAFHTKRSKRPQGFWRTEDSTSRSESNPYERGFFSTTPAGDYCRIWNPETHELPDFELLQRQDEENLRHKRPHPLDALDLDALYPLFSYLPSMGNAHEHLLKWVASRGASTPQVTQGLLTVLRHLRSLLETARPPPRA